MPRRSSSAYPADWKEIARRVKDEAGWACVRCTAQHSPATGYCLTVHHLDLSPSNCRWWNLAALCQRCHLQIQAKVILERPWVMAEHTPWFRPHAAGWYAWRYLGIDLSKEEIMANLDYYLSLERAALLP